VYTFHLNVQIKQLHVSIQKKGNHKFVLQCITSFR